MKHLILFLLLAFSFSEINAQESYARVRVSLQKTDIAQLKALGIDLGNSLYKPGLFIEAEISEYDQLLLEEANIAFEVLIPDMTAWYQTRYEAERDYEIIRDLGDRYPVPENWELGTMGGFYTYQQILDKLDFMREEWPEFISERQPISEVNSHQDRPVWWVRISDDPDIEQEKPKVLYTSLIHAREGIGVQQMFYFMLHLLENYEHNQEIKNLVDHYELYFIPVVNPDGYVHNENNSPGGGGMWRKNRRNNGGSWGVDLNRNFGYMWGIDNNGSSPSPSSDTYRGPGPFSEPETDNIRMFCETYDFQIALNYHSYSNLWLYPWGYTPETCPDDEIFNAHAVLMTQDNNYTYGPGSTTIYATNGGSDDWMYGEQDTKEAIFAYTPEVGSSSDGFWPPISRIIPLCQENQLPNFLAGFLSGNYGQLTEYSPVIVSEHEFYLDFELKRLGFGETQEWTISIEPLDEHIISTNSPVDIGYLEILESVNDSIFIELDPALTSGTPFTFALHLDNGTFMQSDTITKYYGITSIVFFDDCNTMDNWHSNKWNVTFNDYYSPPGSITDSPNGNYQNNEYNPIVLIDPVDLGNTDFAVLNFMAKWDIEPGYDFVQLLASTDGTIGWIPLEGKYTRLGSGNQLPGQPLYDGTSDWVLEEVDISSFAGHGLRLAFILQSDGYVTGDGFYFDDVTITVMDIETGSNEIKPMSSRLMGSIYPNPTNTSIQIPVYTNTDASITISDMHGRVLSILQIEARQQLISMDISNLEKGVYFVNILSDEGSQTEKLIVN